MRHEQKKKPQEFLPQTCSEELVCVLKSVVSSIQPDEQLNHLRTITPLFVVAHNDFICEQWFYLHTMVLFLQHVNKFVPPVFAFPIRCVNDWITERLFKQTTCVFAMKICLIRPTQQVACLNRLFTWTRFSCLWQQFTFIWQLPKWNALIIKKEKLLFKSDS